MLSILKDFYGFSQGRVSELIIKEILTVYEVLKKKHIYITHGRAAVKI